MAYKTSAAKRERQRVWERAHRPKRERDQSATFARWKARQDPNKRREREQEQRFRFREKPVNEEAFLRFHTIYTRASLVVPEFVFVEPRTGRRRREGWMSFDRWEEGIASRLKLAERATR